MRIRLHKLAEAEIREAASWYRDRGEQLVERFLSEVESALRLLESAPAQLPKLETIRADKAYRRVLVKGFPYVIVFEIHEGEVFVYAVAHASRRPNYWKRRRRIDQ